MKYILFFLLTTQILLAGREFVDESQIFNPVAQLHEFKCRYLMIIAKLNCTKYSETEYKKINDDFHALCAEVEFTKSAFVTYFKK